MDSSRPAGPIGCVTLGRLRPVAPYALAIVFTVGCTGEEPVVVETVPKDAAPQAAMAETRAANERMLAAIVPADDTAWFFKVTGPDAAVAAQKPAFLGLIKTLRFEAGQPRWDLPDGWSEKPGNAMRFATLEIPGKPPLELAISSLPYGGKDRTGYLLANVNRWRGQMGLAPMDAGALHSGGGPDDETQELPLEGGIKATLVSLKGRFESGGMTAPFAGGGRMPSGSPATDSPRADAPAEPSPLAYDRPQSWKEIGADGISLATFVIEAESRDVRVTVTPLAASNDLSANINRWREQVGLPQLEKPELEKATETVTLGDGGEGRYVTLVGPKAGEGRRAILGVMAVRDETAWFVKMDGDAETALREKSNFETFVRSLRFSADGG